MVFGVNGLVMSLKYCKIAWFGDIAIRNENPWKNRETDSGEFLEKTFPR